MKEFFRYCEYLIQRDRQTVQMVYEVIRAGQSSRFIETIIFPFELPECPIVHTLLRQLHFAAGTSYYKLFLPEAIVHPYTISPVETAFWNDVFHYGLREFLFTNRLGEDRIASFPKPRGAESKPSARPEAPGTALLAIGGGKDSIVAGEILKKIGVLAEAYVVVVDEVPPQVSGVADEMSLKLHVVQRRIAPQLKELASLPGTYHGHIPISAIFAFVGCMIAAVQGHRYVAVGNESSASLPQAIWKGLDVNHQWSKSLHFERLLQALLVELACPMDYFSPIRTLNAISVAALFSEYPNYFHVFTSDSSSFRMDKQRRPTSRWTLGSSKSLSSFILLLPCLDDPTLLSIFGQNYLDEAGLADMFLSLIGAPGTERILDCVGVPHELRLSLEAAIDQGRHLSSCLVKRAMQQSLISKNPGAVHEIQQLLTPESEHAYPAGLSDDLQKAIHTALEKCRQSRLQNAPYHEVLI